MSLDWETLLFMVANVGLRLHRVARNNVKLDWKKKEAEAELIKSCRIQRKNTITLIHPNPQYCLYRKTLLWAKRGRYRCFQTQKIWVCSICKWQVLVIDVDNVTWHVKGRNHCPVEFGCEIDETQSLSCYILTPRITITGPVKAQLKCLCVESQHLPQNKTNTLTTDMLSRTLDMTESAVCSTHTSASVAPYPSENTRADTPTITNGTP